MSHYKNSESLEAIKARDAELHYCRTCGKRVYKLGDTEDIHFYDVEECDRRLAEASDIAVAEGKPARTMDPDTGHLCWTPKDHHPFLEGPIPDYERAERDRRLLLGVYLENQEDV